MSFLVLVARFATRNRLRFVPTALAVGIVLVAFVLLRATADTWHTIRITAPDRMVVRNRISVTFPLFKHQVDKVRAVPGVRDASWASWFGGIYLNDRQRFTRLAVDAESYLRLYPEYELSSEQKKDWLKDPAGAVAGPNLAKRYGWKVGDKIVMQGTIYPGVWEFTLRAIYRAGPDVGPNNFYFHWKYLNEKVEPGRREQVGTIFARVQNPSVGRSIDRAFANSVAETHTESQEAYARSGLRSASALVSAIQIAAGGVALVLILILGNAMAMATRERTAQYAAMRAIGYRARHIIGFVVAEGFLVAGCGALLGLLVTPPALRAFEAVIREHVGFTWNLALDAPTVALALAVAALSGMLAAAVPAVRAGRLRLVDAFRRVE
jgi:putative ABC transport system permease protein